MAALARGSGVSPAHFARAFHRGFGTPPHRYLLSRRLERAIALLRDTDLTLAEIATATGWRSLGTFGRTFRAATGEAPGACRTRWRSTRDEWARIPSCVVTGLLRPDLRSAVSERAADPPRR